MEPDAADLKIPWTGAALPGNSATINAEGISSIAGKVVMIAMESCVIIRIPDDSGTGW